MGKLMTYFGNVLGLNRQQNYPYPAFDINLSQNRQLHIVGSIHMGTRNMFPLSEILLEQLEQSDALIVEADITQAEAPFQEQLDGQFAPLSQRLSPEYFDCLQNYCREIQYPISLLDPLPSWQISLILQATQAQYLGLRPQYGIDYQLLNSAKAINKPIIELEGADAQIDLLTQLPNDGLSLLEDTITHWHTNAQTLQTMINWWMNYHSESEGQMLPMTFCEDIYQILMTERNQQWSQQLHQLPAGKYVVAVGALHLHGDNNLRQILLSL
ncbi:polysaccharide biosynthesis protein GumN [Xenorhabdus sp. 12]|uniref:Polysaccharide biosynthesis protein GumN n=1 Tax=Xenorhabdus santafensis TaxID=2582833 RepID=A0ABU4SAY7_9GAMM|nr:TraB/GumN family protein [Xenorhabdus sp. 12]MDX7987978.1 polysaccharide biosynthesis protein GumN [Xenorhabdus sp. 12]